MRVLNWKTLAAAILGDVEGGGQGQRFGGKGHV
jgi:hypothetical protein